MGIKKRYCEDILSEIGVSVSGFATFAEQVEELSEMLAKHEKQTLEY